MLFYIGLDSNTGINSMVDTHNYYVYENQRWNPVTGYTSHGLPTDRYMWSDASGRHKRTREHTKLLSMHWHWVIIYIFCIYLNNRVQTFYIKISCFVTGIRLDSRFSYPWRC